MTKTAEFHQPGDLNREDLLARVIRVDHAGEYGARRIYEGQLAVLGRHPQIEHMLKQECDHLAKFQDLAVERRVRPTLLTPFWHVAGFALGAASALLGEKAAMAATEAIESVIDGHYARQMEQLGDDEADLKATLSQFRDDEIEHRDTAAASGAAEAPAYELLSGAVKAGSKLAIWLSERI